MSEPTSSAQARELPTAVRTRLDQLASELRDQLGDNLISLVVFGSAARGGWKAGHSDVDLVLVLRQSSPDVLLSISNTLTVARTSLRFEAIILTADEIPRAADVFPLFYDDIRGCHVLLAGSDVFADLEIADHHRRLRVEQELREMQIRLRRAVVDSMGAPHPLAGAIERKLKQVRGPLHALLTLRKTPAEDDHLSTLLAKAEEIWKVDVVPLAHVREDPFAALDSFNRLLSQIVHEADQLEG